jgi:hypothetical protein
VSVHFFLAGEKGGWLNLARVFHDESACPAFPVFADPRKWKYELTPIFQFFVREK